jgi:hypothetical protein
LNQRISRYNGSRPFFGSLFFLCFDFLFFYFFLIHHDQNILQCGPEIATKVLQCYIGGYAPDDDDDDDSGEVHSGGGGGGGGGGGADGGGGGGGCGGGGGGCGGNGVFSCFDDNRTREEIAAAWGVDEDLWKEYSKSQIRD